MIWFDVSEANEFWLYEPEILSTQTVQCKVYSKITEVECLCIVLHNNIPVVTVIGLKINNNI